MSLLIRYGGGVTRLPLNAHRNHPLLVPLADRGAAIAKPGRGLVAVQPNSRGGPLVPRAASLLAGACAYATRFVAAAGSAAQPGGYGDGRPRGGTPPDLVTWFRYGAMLRASER